MGWFLEHLAAARCVLALFIILEVCIGVVGTCQNGANVHIQLVNQHVLKEWKIPDETDNQYLIKVYYCELFHAVIMLMVN
jgi:hypothetical protein